MAKKPCKKRPCCICRKWFQPDIRQNARQKTCGRPDCKIELHRRNCSKWNNRNKEYFSNNYLNKKLEQVERKEPKEVKHQSPEPPTSKNQTVIASNTSYGLPDEVIVAEYGVRGWVIINYLVQKIIAQSCYKNRGVP